MGEVHPKVPHRRYQFLPTLERRLNPERKIECTLAWVMGKSDVQFGNQHGMWGLCPGKWSEISETFKRRCIDVWCLQEVR